MDSLCKYWEARLDKRNVDSDYSSLTKERPMKKEFKKIKGTHPRSEGVIKRRYSICW